METPSLAKRKRSTGSLLLATPEKLLKSLRDGGKRKGVAKGADEDAKYRLIQALCNCVISAADGDGAEEDPKAVALLKKLLQEPGVDPNCSDERILQRVGGGPLFAALKLDAPQSAKALLEAGASLVEPYGEETPLQVTIASNSTQCMAVVLSHIKRLEATAAR